MDRHLVFPGQVPFETDLLYTNRHVEIEVGMGWLALLGNSTYVSGLPCNPTSPASLQVTVGAGSIFSCGVVDATAYSSLAADTTHQIQRQGVLLDPVTLTLTPPVTTGQSTNYLVQASYADTDANPVVLPYYNAANPSVAWSGPNNTGTPQNTIRKGQCVISLKAGTPAATGSQTTPAPDSGNVGLYVITVANGATTITSGNISTYTSAPFITETLTQKISQTTGDARYARLANANTWTGAQAFSAGATVSGAALIVSGQAVQISGASGTFRSLFLQTAGVARWSVTQDTSDNFFIGRYNTSGMGVDSPISISLSTGLVTVADGLTVTGGITGSLTGNVTGNVSGSSGSCTGNSATASVAGSCSGNSATATSAGTAGSCVGNSATASAISAMPANTIAGNNTGSTASSSDLTVAQVLAMLGGGNLSGSASEYDIPLPGGLLLKAGFYNTSFTEAAGAQTINFGTAFPNGIITCAAQLYVPSPVGNSPYAATVNNFSASGFSFTAAGYQSGGAGGSASGAFWWALGR